MSTSVTESVIAGRYQVIAKVASGGMGEVYRAHDNVLGREVAVKILHPQFAGDRGFVERFRREARAAAILNHPNIVGVYDWGSTNGTYFMVMEFVRGHNLRGILAEYGRLEPAQAVEVTMPVLAALNHAHGHGIVHRDVKPENILISRDGTVKVADFGLARAFAEASISLAEGTVTGTVQYLAPEQIQGQPADPRTDLYALGVVMFEMLAGHTPYTGETSLAIAYKHLRERVPPPSSEVAGVPAALDRVVMHATEKDRANRPASARGMREEVASAARGIPPGRRVAELALSTPTTEFTPPERAATVTIARPESPRERRARKARRFVLWLAVIAAIVAGGWAVWTYSIPHYATVPNVKTMTQQRAFAALKAAGFKPATGTQVYNVKIPPGDAVSTSPSIAARARKGTTVSVSFSKGPRIVAVPSVSNMSAADAVNRLKRAGLDPVIKQRYSDSVKAGTVIGTNPAAAARIQQGQGITVFVSKGPAPVKIPDVSNRSVQDAINILQANGLRVGRKVHEFSTTVQKGDVIGTLPKAGTAAHRTDTVELIVSKGPQAFKMPNVVGMSQASAQAELQGMGLNVRVITFSGNPKGFVAAQAPAAGAIVHQGQTVTIYVFS